MADPTAGDAAYSHVPTLAEAEALRASHRWCFGAYEHADAGIVSYKYTLGGGRWFESAGPEARAIGLNLRGTTFDAATGALVALPLPKFFNVGEPACAVAALDAAAVRSATLITEKIDGSLIAFFRAPADGAIRHKSMRSLDNVPVRAAAALMDAWTPDEKGAFDAYVAALVDARWTPMFELVAPAARIVVAYDAAALYFIGARSMATGALALTPAEVAAALPTAPPLPPHIALPRTIAPSLAAVAAHLAAPNVEGLVCRLGSGTIVKVKAEAYVSLHSAMCLHAPGTIAAAIADGTMDDTLARLATAGLSERVALAADVAAVFDARVADVCAAVRAHVATASSPKALARALADAHAPRAFKALAFRCIRSPADGDADLADAAARAVGAEMGMFHIRAFAAGTNKPPWYVGVSFAAHDAKWTAKARANVFLGARLGHAYEPLHLEPHEAAYVLGGAPPGVATGGGGGQGEPTTGTGPCQ